MRARGMPYNRMIPKSGYRFSDKIMRKRRSTTPLSTTASRLNRRWDRLRLDRALRTPTPDFAALHPGYKAKK
jgi:hypothetical protein